MMSEKRCLNSSSSSRKCRSFPAGFGLVGLALLMMMTHPYPVFASKEVSLKDIVVANTRDELMLYFTVQDAFNHEIDDALLKGVPASFSFYIFVYQKNDAWLNKKIVEMELKSTLKYSALKQQFSLTRPWAGDKPMVTPTLDQAKSLMSHIYALPILPLSRLEKGEQYEIRIKAEMNGDSRPRYSQYLILFASMWNIETDWYKVNIIY